METKRIIYLLFFIKFFLNYSTLLFFFSNFIGLIFSCNHWNTTYNTGMLKIPIIVPINTPNTAPVPIERLPTYPTPVAKTKGSNPKTKAKDVIKIGLNLALAPFKARSEERRVGKQGRARRRTGQ